MSVQRRASIARTCFVTLCLLTALTVAGCGGGGSASGPSAGSKAAYVPNFASETDPQTHLPNKLFHWSSFPVKLFVAPANATPDTRSAALSGTTWWEQALGHVGTFSMVDSTDKADITLEFKDNGANGFSGQTLYSYDSNGTLVKANITLNLNYLTDTFQFTPAAAHEMGHALGIGGHSNETTDLMSFSPAMFLLNAPSLRDLNTMKTSYLDLFSGGPAARSAGPIQTAIVRCTAGK